jgi:5-methylcytosine-specific restriction endonuclease McrA
MKSYSLGHLADGTLLLGLSQLVERDRSTTTQLLAHLAEVDERRLYAPAGYPSMYHYCVGELKLSEDAALKRLQVARIARQFPVIFEALADGRTHLSGVVLLAPHLTRENVNQLLAAAAHQTKARIEILLAGLSPKPDVPAVVMEIAPASPPVALAPEPSALATTEHAPGHVNERNSLPRLAPLAPQRFALQFTIDQEGHDNLRELQELLSHRIPTGDIAQVIGHALRVALRDVKKRKFGETKSPRARTSSSGVRHIPAHVRRAVRERDGCRCTFTSDTGHRCDARKFLEFDHVVPVARGGGSTIANVRLRCRAHNQLEAERAFGVELMNRRRKEAQQARAEAREQAEAARAEAAARARAAAEQVRVAAEASAAAERARGEVVPLLRQLGFRGEEARRAVTLAAADPGAPLEERVRLALRHLAPPSSRRSARLASQSAGATSPRASIPQPVFHTEPASERSALWDPAAVG